MPAIVRGGGGGKNTKDATAVPGDVRSGKTFYGANGKQTGIWTPKVTDYTGDATAVPSDVAKGKVFYNNQGRQVGTGDVFPYMVINFAKNTVIESISNVKLGITYVSGITDFVYNSPKKQISPGNNTVIAVSDSTTYSIYGVFAETNIDIRNVRDITLKIGSYVYHLNFYLYFRDNKGMGIPIYDNSRELILDTTNTYGGKFFIHLSNNIIRKIGLCLNVSSEKNLTLKYDCQITIS